MNMQSANAFVSLPTVASTSSTPLIALGGGISNKAEDRSMASLWIQRLKPQEEPSSLRGETLVSDNGMLPGLHAGNSDASGSTHPFGIHLQEAFFTKAGGNKPLSRIRKLDEKKAVFVDAAKKEQRLSSVGQDDGAQKQKNLVKQGRQKIILLADSHMGGDKQTNKIADAKCERKLPTKLMMEMNVNPRCTSEAALNLQICIQAAESKSQDLHAVRVQEGGILTGSLGKPPLPPSHNKAGLPPRSATHKSSSFLARSAGKLNSSLAINSKLAVPPLQDIATHPSHISAMNERLPAPSVGLGTHQLAVRHSEESFKKPNGLETSERASTTLPKESSVLKTPSKCTVVSSQADASTTACFLWEMFAGAGGPSGSARGEFVEVYNRACNELKDQSSSSPITKVFYKEMENCPRFASGYATCLQDTLIVEHEGQTSDRQPKREIPRKRKKVEGLDNVAQHGVKVMATSVQNELFSEKHNFASFLEGDADISPGKNLQAFGSVHIPCAEENKPLMHGQSGSPLFGCVESPAAVGQQKDYSSTFDKRSQCRRGFACSTIAEGAASSTHSHEPLWTAHRDQSDRVTHDNQRTLMILSKRQLGRFDSSSKESFQRIMLLKKSDAWLQRWYPPYITQIQGLQELKHSESDRLGQDSAGNMLVAKESDEHGACVKEKAVKRRLIEKGVLYQRIAAGEHTECLKVCSEKVLPSAAAMAIVGTTARQFCMVEPQQKGSFTFWSGFGMQTQPQDHFPE